MLDVRNLHLSNRGLLAPDSFLTASLQALSDTCDGAGTDGVDVPDAFLGLSISPAADIHDWMYHFATTRRDKMIADTVFLVNMIILILGADQVAGFWERRKIWPRLRLASLYFIMVWRFGRCDSAGIVPFWARAITTLRRWGLSK